MELILSIAYASFFVFLIGKMKFFHIDGISISMVKAGYLIKVLAGVCVGLIYTYYYTDRLTADTFKFFDDSKILFDSIQQHPKDFIRMLTGLNAGATELQPYYDKMTNWYDTFSPYNDNRTMIRLNAFLRFFSFGHYYVHVVFVCFLSLTGIVAIVKVFQSEFPSRVFEIFMVFLLLPSVLFWGSGLLKDALVFFTLGLVLYWFNCLMQKKFSAGVSTFWFLAALFLLMISKFHVFVLVIPLLIAWMLSIKTKIPPFVTFFVTSLISLGVFVLLSYVSPELNLASILAQKQSAFFDLANKSAAGSAIAIPMLEPNFMSLLINSPHAFFICLFRPFITDGGSVLITLSAIENLVILTFLVYSLFHLKLHVIQNKVMPWFSLFYTITLFILIGSVTPVMGAIVRYKAQALPFLVCFLIVVSDLPLKEKIIKFLSKSRS